MAKPTETAPMRVVEETPAYWRVVFDYPPFNIVDADIFESLQNLLVRMDTSQNLRVVVFESAIPDFYLSHFDLTGKLGNIMTAVGLSGLPILMDTFVRLTTSPVVSIARIRGCVRGASSEFVLACDMRFASRENTRLGQPQANEKYYDTDDYGTHAVNYTSRVAEECRGAGLRWQAIVLGYLT